MGYQKTLCTGITAGTRFYNTKNSNHLDQTIGSNKHKLNWLVNYNTEECSVSQDKKDTLRKLFTLGL